MPNSKHEIVSSIEIRKEDLDSLRTKIKSWPDAEAVFSSFADASSASSTSDFFAVILAAGLAMDASDIHLESAKQDFLLRFRVDGLLHDVSRFPGSFYSKILSRIKLLSGLKINIINTPQDGRFTIKIENSEIEVRVSTLPSEFGEAVVMRILNPKEIGLTLADLGLRSDNADILSREIKKPNGMILVTGPTGSGKTTTLYACLKAVANPELKIITIEDPIEYHLSGIEQTQADVESGYTFASGLRSILRQDPDVILVGEIRDGETAEIAIHASLTGHLVFSTLHTNSAIGAVPRLIDAGIKPSVIGPALTLVIAQRLLRRLCPNCRREVAISPEISSKIEKLMSAMPKAVNPYITAPKIYESVGCDKCHDGYLGRVGLFEFLKLDDDFEALINKDATEAAIRKLAFEKGFVNMQIDGILKALAGITTLQEVEKATGPLEW